MAIIRNGGKDKPSGKVGDLVYRNTATGTVIAKAPTSYKKPKDKASQERFDSFAISAFLGKTIGTSKVLKPVWKSCSIKGPGAYHKFMSVNRKQVTSNYDLKKFHLAPPENQFALKASASLAKDNLNVKIDPLGNESGIKPERELYVQLCGYVLFSHPLEANIGSHRVAEILSEVSNTNLDTALEFNFDFAKNPDLQEDSMNKRTFFGVVVTFNSEYQPVRWSETFSASMMIDPNAKIVTGHAEEK